MLTRAMGGELKSVRWAVDCSLWTPSLRDLLPASASVQSEEKERIKRLVFARDAKRSLVGRLLMRKFASEAGGVPWSEALFARDAHGKPLLESPAWPPLRFNVSHSGRFAVLAGEREPLSLGVDVMKSEYTGGKSTSEFFRLMERHFSAEEWTTIRGEGGEKRQMDMFFRYWCLKESYVKAVGTGLTENLKEINFKVNTLRLKDNNFVEDTQLFLKGHRQDNWLFQETLLNGDHCVAVALSCSDLSNYKGVTKGFTFLNFENLIEKCEDIGPTDEQFCYDFLGKEKAPE